MRTRTVSAVGGTLLGGALVLGVASPALAAPCDAYSGVCPSPTPSIAPIDGGSGGEGGAPGGGSTGGPVRGHTTDGPSALPFTGAELVLLTALGAAAIGGGTVLVAAGRRRRTA